MIIFSFFDIKILEKFNQKIEKLVKLILEKQKKLKIIPISLSKNSEISPGKKTLRATQANNLNCTIKSFPLSFSRAGNEPPWAWVCQVWVVQANH